MYAYFVILYVYIYCYLCYNLQYSGKGIAILPPLLFERRCYFAINCKVRKKQILNIAKTSIKRIPLDVQKEKYEKIKIAAEAAGESINGYIKKAVDQRMEQDCKK